MPKQAEQVICAWAERASGPGWSNEVLWYIVRDPTTGQLTQRALQPGQQSDDMRTLFDVSASVSKSLKRAVEDHLHRESVVKLFEGPKTDAPLPKGKWWGVWVKYRGGQLWASDYLDHPGAIPFQQANGETALAFPTPEGAEKLARAFSRKSYRSVTVRRIGDDGMPAEEAPGVIGGHEHP
jgi:hypothetical protein